MFTTAANRLLNQLAERQDILFAAFFVLIVCMIILPLPTTAIDVLIAANLAMTLLILVASTYLRSTLELSTFPTILLLSTAFRLALTVSTARLILAHGDAGHIVRGFGQFVVAGNVAVGLVIYSTIAIVQFIVITKGAERIAEVSARFTLDAMPGKQMAIDGDLRSGEATKEEARRRRLQLERESQFFGAMDGAMRFVKGDAIASMLVVAVNLLGGFAIGVLQRGLPVSEAGRLYSLLTVGDGLIAQIPAMFLSMAAGAIVTRVITEDSRSMGADITRQLIAEPKALGIAAVVMSGMALVPGFPSGVFCTIATIMGVATWLVARAKPKDKQPAKAPKQQGPAVAPATPQAQGVLRSPQIGDAFVVRIPAPAWDGLVAQGLAPAVEERRSRLSRAMGYDVAPVAFAPRPSGDRAVIEVDGVPVVTPKIPDAPDAAFVATFADKIAGVQRQHAAQAFGVNDAGRWIEALRPHLGRLASEVEQKIPLPRLTEVLRCLLEERLSLAQSRIVLEALQTAGQETDAEVIAERVRFALRRQICHSLVSPDRTLPTIVVAADIEDLLNRTKAGAAGPRSLPSDAGIAQKIAAEARRLLREAEQRQLQPVFLTSANCRRALWRLLSAHQIRASAISFSELADEFQPRPLGSLTLTRKAPEAVPMQVA